MITVATVDSSLGEISVRRNRRTGSLVYSQGGSDQSAADNAGTSLAPYVHAIHGLIHQIRARNVAMIGCGGGTLATMLAQAPCNITVVDVSSQAFFLARKYFGLPDHVECRIADGFAFLLGDDATYDVIVVDAFEGDKIPSQFQSPLFFSTVARRLTSKGCCFVNVHVVHDLDLAADEMASHMEAVWPTVRILDAQGEINRNAIVMAGAVTKLREPAVNMPPAILKDEIEEELSCMRFRHPRKLMVYRRGNVAN